MTEQTSSVLWALHNLIGRCLAASEDFDSSKKPLAHVAVLPEEGPDEVRPVCGVVPLMSENVLLLTDALRAGQFPACLCPYCRETLEHVRSALADLAHPTPEDWNGD